ncbi:MAG: hypothetical protein JW837_10170 [Sedimentisphaerales bacterium]|nr:hypothetical protein [Sedimentisphaerales bacterium]
MKFFVSGKVGAEENVRAAMKALQDAGHEITFDWTTIDHLRPYDKNVVASREAALKESRGVRDADILIILAHDNGIGMYVELGIAIGCEIPIRVVTDVESRTMFFHHPLVKKVDSFRQILEEFS